MTTGQNPRMDVTFTQLVALRRLHPCAAKFILTAAPHGSVLCRSWVARQCITPFLSCPDLAGGSSPDSLAEKLHASSARKQDPGSRISWSYARAGSALLNPQHVPHFVCNDVREQNISQQCGMPLRCREHRIIDNCLQNGPENPNSRTGLTISGHRGQAGRVSIGAHSGGGSRDQVDPQRRAGPLESPRHRDFQC